MDCKAILPDELKGISDFFGKVGAVMTDMNYQRVATLPEALGFLAEHDSTLPDRSEWQLP